MDTKNARGELHWRYNMRILRWVAMVVPILFLVSIDLLRHIVFVKQLHTIPGFLGLYTLISIAVVIFTYVIFGIIGSLQRQITDHNRRLSALNDIAKDAATKLRLNDLLKTSLDHILSNMKADAGLICLVDMEKEEHSAVCHRGFSSEVVRRIQRAKLGDDPVAQEVVRTGRPVIRERVFEDPRVSEVARREGIASAISAPLMFEGEVNGILVIATRQERHFLQVDRDFLEGIGGQLGMAIRNAILYEGSELQNRELGALLAVGKAATSALDRDELLATSLDTLLQVTSADAAEIWLMEGDGELLLRCHRGLHREAFLEQMRFHMGEGIPGIVAQKGEPIVVHDLPSHPAFLRRRVIEAGYHTFCALPLRYKGTLVGVLAVAALPADAFKGERELRLLQGIGEWLALALENVRLYQQVQEVAILQERERIAREMHDGMGQLLGYVNTQAIAVRRFLSDGRLTEAREELTKMEDIARDLYADVREGILGLRIASHQREGLLASLREYAERYMEMSGVKVNFEANGDAERLRVPPSAEIQLIRIVQEALTNVRKHSRATTASVTFQRNGAHLVVTISDNGQGFDPGRIPSTGWPRFGLQTMRERAEAVGGSLHLDTAPSQGTRVEIQIPVMARDSQQGLS